MPKADFDAEGFYAGLTRCVKARGWTWKAVSAATGVSGSTLSRMADGRRPDAASLAALSAWAGLNPADYVPRREPEQPDPVARTRRYVHAFLAALRECGHSPAHVHQVLREMLDAAGVEGEGNG